MSNDSQQTTKRKRWTEIDQLSYDFRGMIAYDDPMEAERLGTILGGCYPGDEALRKWRQEHYVGISNIYDHETGKITHPKLREFFDRRYPDFEEQQRKREERYNDT